MIGFFVQIRKFLTYSSDVNQVPSVIKVMTLLYLMVFSDFMDSALYFLGDIRTINIDYSDLGNSVYHLFARALIVIVCLLKLRSKAIDFILSYEVLSTVISQLVAWILIGGVYLFFQWEFMKNESIYFSTVAFLYLLLMLQGLLRQSDARLKTT